MPDRRFAGKVVLVTGASRGIGEATARRFAAAGARVVLAARTQSDLARVAGDIVADGGEAVAVETDVTDAASVGRLFERTLHVYGRLDAAFNNAGGGHQPKPLADLLEADFEAALSGNLRSTFLCMRLELAAMVRGGGGSIVNMSSTAGIGTAPGMAGYNAAKAGVIALTRTAALEYGPGGIRVNAVAPGPIRTHRLQALSDDVRAGIAAHVPLRRLGEPADVADAVLWLSSAQAGYVNGTTLPIEGGKLIGNA
ncbi:MAG TPA: SDR family NAD(P)-dependent oxidoreductase [Xanthomonadales bacterium]|nr:SDR family NAD(P)-dependent oxidoreductase [Xanthomonadales bacterium]